MLVMSRKQGDSIVIAASSGIERLFKLTVLSIEQGRVELGLEVDGGVAVYPMQPADRENGRSVVFAADARLVDSHRAPN
jgi:hypothetical protein